MKTVCKETLDFLRGQIDWNKQDMGESGEFIRTEYVYNLLDDLAKALVSNRVRLNWPFAEESAQDGANREMSETRNGGKMTDAECRITLLGFNIESWERKKRKAEAEVKKFSEQIEWAEARIKELEGSQEVSEDDEE